MSSRPFSVKQTAPQERREEGVVLTPAQTDRFNVAERSRRALADRARIKGLACDGDGYFESAERNLVCADTWASIAQDLGGGAGSELSAEPPGRRPKFCAAHSSAALAVNTFAPWRDDAMGLEISGLTRFTGLRFEVPCSAGVRGTAPHLDVVAQSADTVLAIESKCTEFLTPKEAAFATAYQTIDDARKQSSWFQFVTSPDVAAGFKHLDVGQLTKHYLGLANTFPEGRVVLLYLFWEPANAGHRAFTSHRRELQKFADLVAGDRVEFSYHGYPELWNEWSQSDKPKTRDHATRLKDRYLVQI